jgi:hypothetical protein
MGYRRENGLSEGKKAKGAKGTISVLVGSWLMGTESILYPVNSMSSSRTFGLGCYRGGFG